MLTAELSLTKKSWQVKEKAENNKKLISRHNKRKYILSMHNAFSFIMYSRSTMVISHLTINQYVYTKKSSIMAWGNHKFGKEINHIRVPSNVPTIWNKYELLKWPMACNPQFMNFCNHF